MTRVYEPGGAHESIARLFGRRPDGSYYIPANLGGIDDLWPSIRRIAQVGGMDVDEVLDFDWIKLLENSLISIVRTESAAFRIWVRENGISRPERSLADLMASQAAEVLLPPRDGESRSSS